jgi:hypothetical protein
MTGAGFGVCPAGLGLLRRKRFVKARKPAEEPSMRGSASRTLRLFAAMPGRVLKVWILL